MTWWRVSFALSLMRSRANSPPTEYVVRSSELGDEYCKLGKYSRASLVFSQAIRIVSESKRDVSKAVRVELHLRFSHFLATQGDTSKA